MTALLAVCAAVISFLLVYALCARFRAGTSPAVLAAALAVGLIRRAEPPPAPELLLRLAFLPLVAFAAALAGMALIEAPLLGAIAFTGIVTLSI